MRLNKFFILVNHYTVVGGASEGPTLRARPSEYLKKLHPHQAVAELKAHISALEGELRKYSPEELDLPANFEKTHNVRFELEVALDYLAHPQKVSSCVIDRALE